MARSRLGLLVLGLAAVGAGPGCITLYSKTETVRAEEQRVAVQFESAQAAKLFNEELERRENCVGKEYLGVPFVTLYRRERVLSKNAFFNDQVRICDCNQDHLVTENEALVYVGKTHLCREPFLGAPPGQPAVLQASGN
jgi:hypothetical protein